MGRGGLVRLGAAILASVLLLGGAGVAPRAARAQDGRDSPRDGKGPPQDGKPDGKNAPADPKAGPPPDKKDDRGAASDEVAKAAIERFERDFAGKDEGRRVAAISNLGATRNDLVTKKLGTLLGHQDVQVRVAAAQELDGQAQNRALSGELLRKAAAREEDAEVLIAITATLAKIQYAKAIPDMGDLALRSREFAVKLEVLKALARMKDGRALLPILDLWLVHPQAVPADAGGEVRCDPGAPGDGDGKKAEEAFRLLYGDQRRKGTPAPTLKNYLQAVADAAEKVAGERLSSPTELMQWLVRHEADLGFKLPARVAQTLKEYQDRAAKAKTR